MEDSLIISKSYPENLERVPQDKRARTLMRCYARVGTRLNFMIRE